MELTGSQNVRAGIDMETTAAEHSVEVTIARAARPFRVTGVDASRAKEIIESFLAAWGLPAPAGVRSAFAEQLATDGEYRFNAEDYQIIVKRSV